MAGLKGKSGPPGNMNAFKHRCQRFALDVFYLTPMARRFAMPRGHIV